MKKDKQMREIENKQDRELINKMKEVIEVLKREIEKEKWYDAWDSVFWLSKQVAHLRDKDD